jgi:hypothetical protein
MSLGVCSRLFPVSCKESPSPNIGFENAAGHFLTTVSFSLTSCQESLSLGIGSSSDAFSPKDCISFDDNGLAVHSTRGWFPVVAGHNAMYGKVMDFHGSERLELLYSPRAGANSHAAHMRRPRRRRLRRGVRWMQIHCMAGSRSESAANGWWATGDLPSGVSRMAARPRGWTAPGHAASRGEKAETAGSVIRERRRRKA